MVLVNILSMIGSPHIAVQRHGAKNGLVIIEGYYQTEGDITIVRAVQCLKQGA